MWLIPTNYSCDLETTMPLIQEYQKAISKIGTKNSYIYYVGINPKGKQTLPQPTLARFNVVQRHLV